MNTLFLFRVDAGEHLGYRRFTRCMTLAEECRRRGGQVVFLTHSENGELADLLKVAKFNFIPVLKTHPHPLDLETTIRTALTFSKHLAGPERAWIVLDGERFDRQYQLRAHDTGLNILCFDELAQVLHYHAHLVVNENVYAPLLRYSTDSDTVTQLGCQHALFNPEILRFRSRLKQVRAQAEKILILAGNARNLAPAKTIIRILGAEVNRSIPLMVSSPSVLKVKDFSKSDHYYFDKLELVTDIHLDPEPLFKADMVISTDGSYSLEALYLGIPHAVLSTDEESDELLRTLGNNGILNYLGWHEEARPRELASTLRQLIMNQDLRRKLSQTSERLFDGRGTERVSEALFHSSMPLLAQA